MRYIIIAFVFTLLGATIAFIVLKKYNNSNNKSMRRKRHKQKPHLHRSYEQTDKTTGSFCNVIESQPSTIAIIYRSEMNYISRCINDYPNIETGGQLFGFITENGSPVVCYAIGPGRDANHQPTFFNQDTEYLQTIYNKLNNIYGLRYIGEWHSHHQLSLAKPSGHDATTVVHGMQKNHFRHFLLCIGNCDNQYHSTLNAFTFHTNDIYNYFHAPWKIIEIESPYRPLVDRELQNILFHPRTELASYGSNYIISDSDKPVMITPNYSDNYWLNQKSNNMVLKHIIDFLTNYNGYEYIVKPQLDANKHVHIFIEETEQNRSIHITFGENFPVEAPIIVPSFNIPFNKNAKWNYTENIFESFKNYYDSFFKVDSSE